MTLQHVGDGPKGTIAVALMPLCITIVAALAFVFTSYKRKNT